MIPINPEHSFLLSAHPLPPITLSCSVGSCFPSSVTTDGCCLVSSCKQRRWSMEQAPWSSHTGCFCSACTAVSVGAGTAIFSPDPTSSPWQWHWGLQGLLPKNKAARMPLSGSLMSRWMPLRGCWPCDVCVSSMRIFFFF